MFATIFTLPVVLASEPSTLCYRSLKPSRKKRLQPPVYNRRIPHGHVDLGRRFKSPSEATIQQFLILQFKFSVGLRSVRGIIFL